MSDFKRAGFSREDLQIVAQELQKDGKIEYKNFINKILQSNVKATHTSNVESEALNLLRKYFTDHPASLRSEFESFDPRRTGKVTAQNFK